jgi:hypothetical protein
MIYADRRFWRLAPVSALCIGSAWALQGLWAAPWLADVVSLGRSEIVHHLFIMAMALCAGALLIGVVADALRCRGVGSETVLSPSRFAMSGAKNLQLGGSHEPHRRMISSPLWC